MNNGATTKQYVIGFVFSVILTFASYFAVVNKVFNNSALIFVVMSCALVQFIVQLFFFLHLGKEEKPRWNLLVFFSAIFIVLILVIGSIWIMNHLNYHMTPGQMNDYMLKSEGLMK